MKRKILLILAVLILTAGCSHPPESADIVATTLPVWEFTTLLCQGTDLQVERLITENVSCLHDYTLKVSQMRAVENAETVVINGAGLESFLDDILSGKSHVADASEHIDLLCPETEHEHHDHHDDHGHSHESDSHIWLSPENAKIMAENICQSLCKAYPQHAELFTANLEELTARLDALQKYGETELSNLSCREIITFHDGFAYFARSFGLTILEAVEEESGSEASAKELIHLIEIVEEHDLPAIFTEVNGSVSAASVISAETGALVYYLDMAMGAGSYFDAMYHNIDTIKETLQ